MLCVHCWISRSHNVIWAICGRTSQTAGCIFPKRWPHLQSAGGSRSQNTERRASPAHHQSPGALSPDTRPARNRQLSWRDIYAPELSGASDHRDLSCFAMHDVEPADVMQARRFSWMSAARLLQCTGHVAEAASGFWAMGRRLSWTQWRDDWFWCGIKMPGDVGKDYFLMMLIFNGCERSFQWVWLNEEAGNLSLVTHWCPYVIPWEKCYLTTTYNNIYTLIFIQHRSAQSRYTYTRGYRRRKAVPVSKLSMEQVDIPFLNGCTLNQVEVTHKKFTFVAWFMKLNKFLANVMYY